MIKLYFVADMEVRNSSMKDIATDMRYISLFVSFIAQLRRIVNRLMVLAGVFLLKKLLCCLGKP